LFNEGLATFGLSDDFFVSPPGVSLSFQERKKMASMAGKRYFIYLAVEQK